MPPDDTTRPPSIPDYELVRLIGRGSYGDVWLARGVTGVFRAIKFVWRDRFSDVRPYEREFEGITRFAAVSLREPSQLALLHVGRDETARFFYYVMELADDATRGREIDPAAYTPLTLKEHAAERMPLPPAEVIELGAVLARAVASLHTAGLVHRDIKPSNIIFVGGVPKLADVGLVAAASAELTFVGTEGFVPPEGPGAPAADVFSLGKVLYELATGLDRHDWPRLPADLAHRADRTALLELNEVLLKACEPSPAARFTDAAALLDELLLLQAGKSVRKLRNAERRLTRALRIAAVLALVAGIAGAGAYLERRRADEETAHRARAEAERDAAVRRAYYAAMLGQVQRSLENGDFGQARALLDRVNPKSGSPDLRGFEWRILQQEAAGDPAKILRATGPAAGRACFSPTGEFLAVHDESKTVTLFRTTNWQEVRRIPAIHRLAGFSADGTWVVGTDPAFAPARWSVRDGLPDLSPPDGTNRPLHVLAGDQLLCFTDGADGQPHRLRAWDLAARRARWTQPVPHTEGPLRGNFFAAAVHPDGNRCALALIHGIGQQATWRILVLTLPGMEVLWDEVQPRRPTALAFGESPDVVACAWGGSSELSLLDLRTRTWAWTTRLRSSQIQTLARIGPGLFGAGGRDDWLELVDAGTGRVLGSRRGQTSGVQSVASHPHTSTLVTTGNGGDVRIWAADPSANPRELPGYWAPAGGGRALALSPDGHLLAATLAGNRVSVTDTRSGTETIALPGMRAPIAFTSDNRSLWVLTDSGRIERRTATAEATLLSAIPAPAAGAVPVAAALTGRQVAMLDATGHLSIAQLETQQWTASIRTGHAVAWWVALSPDGRFACTSGNDQIVRLWSLPELGLAAEWKSATPVVNGEFSPDGTRIALALGNGSLDIRSVATPASGRLIPTSSGVLQALAFHPRESRLLVGGRNGTLHVFDTEDWSELLRLSATEPSQPKPGTLVRAVVSRDGRVLAGYLENGTVRLWRADGDADHSPLEPSGGGGEPSSN